MSLTIAARIARRELRGGLKGFRVFLACLSLGVAAIAAVGTVRESIQMGLLREGATILGGDAEIELTYRFASDDERHWMAATSIGYSEIVDFRSMAVVDRAGNTERGLTQIKAVDQAYPIYGAVNLEPAMELSAALDGQDTLPGAVMDRVLVDRLGLGIGEIFRLGQTDFVLSAVLAREPDNATGIFTLGPRTIVRTADLAESGLLQPGTLFETAYRLRLPPGRDLDAVQVAAETAIEGGFRWRDSRNGAPGVTEFVDRLGSFLILVGLAGLAVGGVGVSAAVRAYLDEKVRVIATLKSLGAEGRTIFQVYLLQIGLMTVLGVILGLILGAGASLLLAPVIEARLPVPTVPGLQGAPLAEAALYGILAAALFAVWPLSRTENVRAATLFRDATLGISGWPRARYVAFSAIVLALLIGAAATFSGQIRLTLWATGGMLAAFLTLVLAAFALRHLTRVLAKSRALRRRTSLRLALASVGGPGGEATSVVLSLGLGLAVLAAVGQIDANLQNAVARDMPDHAPSFFVLDIQGDQMDGFKSRLSDDPGVTRVQSAPMLRGIITRINGLPAAEVAGDHWVISGDRGITYSARLPAGSDLTEGSWWPEGYTGAPQISFSAHEAEEIGLKLGDTMTINVLARDIVGTITSFRTVDFSNAGMGFVLSVNPAAIAGAPHTFIATIYADQGAEAAILRDLASAYPNITAIRVRDAIERVAGVLRGIAAAITYGALATLVTGVAVLIGAAAAGERARTYEAAVLKTLGATRWVVLTNFALRSVILGAAAGGVAILAGGIAGWAVMVFVMDSEFSFEPLSALAIVAGGIGLTTLAGLGFSLRSLGARPAQVLRARE
ncbi:MAG: ABC transporter permease [Paracoccaceae bacterium]